MKSAQSPIVIVTTIKYERDIALTTNCIAKIIDYKEENIVIYILDQIPELKDMYVRINTIRVLNKHNKAELLTEEIKCIYIHINLLLYILQV